MKTLIRGKIVDFVPFFNGYLSGEGVLAIGEKGEFPLTVDTGFSGGIALPEEILEKMGIEFIGYEAFSLATGDIVELPMYLGKVIIGKDEIKTWFIPGDLLLGMEFLSSRWSVLSLNFEDGTVTLTK